MKELQINIIINPELFIKNPDSSELGQKIVHKGIQLILELGFEAFTFKKLAENIDTSEASIYRYFENKHLFLVYLTCWYWSWMELNLVLSVSNIESAAKRLKTAISLITDPSLISDSFSYIDKEVLQQIIVTESIKAYHTKDVDTDNKKGFFKVYKRLVKRVGDIVLELNPDFSYPHTLVSTIIEGAHNQRYFRHHLPSLTDDNMADNSISSFYTDLAFKVIESK